MLEMDGMTAAALRARADQLREVLRVLDDSGVEASARERAYIVGALHAVELMQADLSRDSSNVPFSGDGRTR